MAVAGMSGKMPLGVRRPVLSCVVPIVTLGVTHGAAEDVLGCNKRKFWPDCRRGGMAEWSMAVVLPREASIVSQFEFLSAVRRASRAIKQERTSTESRHRRLYRWPPGGAAAGGRRRMACHYQARRGGGRVDTHR